MSDKKKYSLTKNYCFLLASLFIFSGCSTADKEKELLKVQQQRITGLKKQLARKNQEIQKLKANKWVNAPTQTPESVAIRPLKKLVDAKKWIPALKLSSQLNQQYPQSVKIPYYRYQIYKAMGLNKQANEIRRKIKKQQARQKMRSKKL